MSVQTEDGTGRPDEADGPGPGDGHGFVRGLYERFAHLIHELGKFGVVGFASFVVDVVLFNLLRSGFEFGPLTSKTISVAIAATLAFAGNRFWTWRHRKNSGLAREYFLYFVFNAVGLLIALLCLGFSHYVLGHYWPGVFTGLIADNIAANGFGLVLGTMFRFYSYRRWVFLPADAPPVDPHTGLPEAPPDGNGDEVWYGS